MVKGTYDEQIIEKFGRFEAYDDYDTTYEIKTDPAVFKFSRDYFLQPGEKHEKKTIYHDKIKQPKKLEDQYRISYDKNK